VPGPLLHVGATATCPHSAGQVTIIPSNTRVTVGGQPVAVVSDQCMIAGCPFTIPPTPGPQPCMTVQWIVPATRVTVMGQPALLQTSTGICLSATSIPAGPPIVSQCQMRATGT